MGPKLPEIWRFMLNGITWRPHWIYIAKIIYFIIFKLLDNSQVWRKKPKRNEQMQPKLVEFWVICRPFGSGCHIRLWANFRVAQELILKSMAYSSWIHWEYIEWKEKIAVMTWLGPILLFLFIADENTGKMFVIIIILRHPKPTTSQKWSNCDF